ncbi:MAG: glycine cleavage system protein GcvH [Actinomycetota bacterium]|nr:glycine cleavage system protein GcvH [Actinomycetota bacterium]
MEGDMYPAQLRYTTEHEWVRTEADGTAVFGITEFAQDALGDIVYVTMPAAGESLSAGVPCGEVESTKSVSDIFSPLDGVVISRNDNLTTAPETINADPYGAGWLVTMRPSDPGQFAGLLSATEYAAIALKE